MEIWVIKKRSWSETARTYVTWKYREFKSFVSNLYEDIKIFIKNEEICYYNYTTQRVIFVKGRTMLRSRSKETFGSIINIAQLATYRNMEHGEVVYLNLDGTKCFCERF